MRTLFIPLLLVGLVGCAPSMPPKDGPQVIDTLNSHIATSYEEVVTATGSKDELFGRASRWFAENVRDANTSIKLKDKESGEVLGKIFLGYEFKTLGTLSDWVCASDRYIYTSVEMYSNVQILCKDNRFKYRIDLTDYRVSNPYRGTCSHAAGPSRATNKATILTINNEIEARDRALIDSLVKGLKQYMQQPEKEW